MEEPLVDEMDLCSLVERSPMTDIQVDFGSDRRRDLDIERERDRRREITSIRQQEYFVPGDGINHEIIEADITRYLGNDALVRPGDYEDPQTREIRHGYLIISYRNLTTAMIADLKTDSARWEDETRSQVTTKSAPQYTGSTIHQPRQFYGPTESTYSQYISRQYHGPSEPTSGGDVTRTFYPLSTEQYPYQTAPHYTSPYQNKTLSIGATSCGYGYGYPTLPSKKELVEGTKGPTRMDTGET